MGVQSMEVPRDPVEADDIYQYLGYKEKDTE